MDLLGVRSLPYLARRNYYYEIKHLIPWSVLAAVVEGGQFASVVIARSFNGSATLIAIATATPVAALLFSLVWGALCIGRPKVRLLTLFAAAAALCAGSAFAIPSTPSGAIWFLVQMAAAQALLAGVVTIRSAVWRSNYPRSDRGRITARLQGARVVVSVVTVLIAAAICDRNPDAYRLVYPVAALCGLASLTILPRLHIRGEKGEIDRHHRPAYQGDLRRGWAEPFSLTALLGRGHVIRQLLMVLPNDHRFAKYCLAQSLTGVGNLMTISVVVTVVTRELPLGDRWGFWISLVLIQGLPRLLLLSTLRRWGGLFDRLGVVRFRVVNMACWMTAVMFGMAATLVTVYHAQIGPVFFPIAIALFSLRGITQGVALGGAALAWNLGHLHFAKPEQAELYMGIHVSLTGLRGLIAPLGGIWLWHTIGWPVWLIALALCAASMCMFISMARHESRVGMPTAPGDLGG